MRIKWINKVKHKKTRFNTNLASYSRSMLFFRHLHKEEKDNEYDKVIQWILKNAHL